VNDDDDARRMNTVREDGKLLNELAGRARRAWDDPEVASPRDAWVRYDDDESIVGWGYAHGVLP
jgi:hypothetical protein